MEGLGEIPLQTDGKRKELYAKIQSARNRLFELVKESKSILDEKRRFMEELSRANRRRQLIVDEGRAGEDGNDVLPYESVADIDYQIKCRSSDINIIGGINPTVRDDIQRELDRLRLSRESALRLLASNEEFRKIEMRIPELCSKIWGMDARLEEINAEKNAVGASITRLEGEVQRVWEEIKEAQHSKVRGRATKEIKGEEASSRRRRRHREDVGRLLEQLILFLERFVVAEEERESAACESSDGHLDATRVAKGFEGCERLIRKEDRCEEEEVFGRSRSGSSAPPAKGKVKGKGKGKAKSKQQKRIAVPFDILCDFEKFGVRPPATHEDVPPVLNNLKAKLTSFQSRHHPPTQPQ
eukprot:Gb_23982 [translate_table: standard]